MVAAVKRDLMHIFDALAVAFDHSRRRYWSEAYFLAWDSGVAVDFGCGAGRHLFLLSSFGREVVGVDLSAKMVALALSKIRGSSAYYLVNGVQCDINFLPFRSSSISDGLCFATLHHIPSYIERLKALSEIFRSLKPFGVLIVSVWARYQRRFFSRLPIMLLDRILGRCGEFGDIYVPWRTCGGVYRRFYHLFSRGEFLKLLRLSGFSLAFSYGKSFKSSWFSENHMAFCFKSSKS